MVYKDGGGGRRAVDEVGVAGDDVEKEGKRREKVEEEVQHKFCNYSLWLQANTCYRSGSRLCHLASALPFPVETEEGKKRVGAVPCLLAEGADADSIQKR
jgi:hypothetical protein